MGERTYLDTIVDGEPMRYKKYEKVVSINFFRTARHDRRKAIEWYDPKINI